MVHAQRKMGKSDTSLTFKVSEIEKYQSRYNQQQGGNQPTQAVNGNQPTITQGTGQMSAQQAAMESARNAASASNFPPAVDANGSPIQGNNDDLPF